MKKNTKRVLGVVAGLLVIVLGFIASGALASAKEAPPKQQRKKSVREVRVRQVNPSQAPVAIALQGRLVAVQRLPIIAEVTGIFEASDRPFKQGVYYRKGDVLARINDTEARYALLAQKSTLANSIAQAMPELKIDHAETFPAWDGYLRRLNVEQPLPELPSAMTDAARFFLNGKNIYTQYYQIKGAEERLSKYTLRAPFAGTLTETSATVGALIRQSQPLGTLTATNYELAATVPVADLTHLQPGAKASLTGPEGQRYEATVSRLSTQIDPATQTATAFLSVRGKGLREGLYLRGEARGASLGDVTVLDQRFLVGADEVYVLRDSVLRRTPIEIVRRNEDQLYLRGLPAGTTVLDEAVPGAYDGMRVKPVKSEKRGSEE